MQSASKRRSSIDGPGILDSDVGVDSIHRFGSQSLKACKIEDDLLTDSGETTFALFASLLDSALQGAWSRIVFKELYLGSFFPIC